MRAITGAVVSSKPSTLHKAFVILNRFYNSSSSDSDLLPSADCAAYLHTATEAVREHELFRRDLRGNQQQGAANSEAHEYEGEVKHQDRERKGDIAGSESERDSAAEVEPDAAAGEKKSKKKKNKEDRQQGGPVAGVESHTPSSPEISREKRKKEKHSVKEVIVNVKQEPDLVADEKLLSEKKSKKKNEKVRVKLEEEAGDADEVGGKIVKDGGSQQDVATGEKKRKKKKREEEEVNYKGVKQEEKMVMDGDLDSEKKRKKKRGRGDNDDNTLEQVEHTKKKQRK